MAARVGEPPTMPGDETLSQPSTSTGTSEAMNDVEPEKDPSSDSDASIGWADYEHRKDVIVKRLVLCEQQMARMKVTAKHTRLKDYELRKLSIANRTDPEYLERIAAMEKEVEKEQDKMRTALDLEMASLERVNEGEKDFISRGYRDRLQYKKSMALYDLRLKINKVTERIWREDEVRADVRIFVGPHVPDDWLDEFVKSYVDEEEAEVNSEDAVRERNRQRYRREAGESLDDGRPLSAILDRVDAARHAHPSGLKPLPRVYYDEQERELIEKAKKKEREKIIAKKIKAERDKNIGRFFADKSRHESPPLERLNADSVKVDDLDTVRLKIKSNSNKNMTKAELTRLRTALKKKLKLRERRRKKPAGINGSAALQRRNETVTVDPESSKIDQERTMKEKILDARTKELERLKKQRDELIQQKMELEKKEESDSDSEQLDIETTMREGVRAVLMTHGQGHMNSSTDCEKRVGRLKKALTSMLNMKKTRVDPDLQRARERLLKSWGVDEKDLKSLKKQSIVEKRKAKRQNELEEENLAVEEQLRRSALMKGLVNKSLKRPIIGGKWIDDEDGSVKRAAEILTKMRMQTISHHLTVKQQQFEKEKKLAEDSESEWEDDKNGKKKRKKKLMINRRKNSSESEIIIIGEHRMNGSNGQPPTEKERIEKAKKILEIRAVIEGRDPTKIVEIKEKEKEKIDEVEIIELEDVKKKEKEKEMNGKLKRTKEVYKGKNGRTIQRIPDYASDSDHADDYGSQRRKYGGIPEYRLAAPPPPPPRLNLQLSEDRIMQDLFRSGALRQRETYGEYIERMDRERSQRLLSRIPRSERHERIALLSPRSQLALKTFPHAAMRRLSRKDRRAFLNELPSTSSAGFENLSEDEEGDEDDDEYDDEEEEESEELSEEWELENEEEEEEARRRMKMKKKKEEKIVKEEEEDDQMMEVDDYPIDDEVVEEEEEMKEETEEPRIEEMEEFSPIGTVSASPLLPETTTKKKATPRMNGFSRTGKATVA